MPVEANGPGLTFIDEKLYRRYTDSLISGNRPSCNNIILELVNRGTPVETIYLDLFQRSLYEVGDLWERNRLSVAHEHMATAITERLMSSLYTQIFGGVDEGKSVLVACVPEEYHQVGAKMVADTFEMHGWNSMFLGANTPPHDIMTFIQEKKPDLIALSLSIYFNVENLKKLLSMIRGDFRDREIILGGQAFRWGGIEVAGKYTNTAYITSIRDLHRIFTK
jgi:methanogenic corrinoid protein MtbC1